MTEIAEELRYPIGKFAYDAEVTDEKRRASIIEISRLPWRLRAAVAGWDDEKLNTPYRPEGWTVRQLIHHVADSHINSYVRFKLALTESEPTIKGYDEVAWAELQDGKNAPVELSLKLLDVLHERWTMLLESFGPAEFARTLNHSENGVMTLDKMLQLYAWHSNHHVAHITALAERKGWGRKRG